MGEIADALRRARQAQRGAGGRRGGLGLPTDPPAAGAREPGRGLEAAPLPREALQSLAPADPAIVRSPGPELEACRQLALELRIELERRNAHSVAVVSALRDEGKTTTSCNLAIALASLSPGRSVALVDLDLRKPSVARTLGLRVGAGVEGYLAGTASLEDVRIGIEDPPLDVYPTAAPQHEAHQLLSNGPLGDLVVALERRYETVLFDTSPALLVPDARLVLRQVAVGIPLARAGTTRVRAYRELIEALPQGRILGGLLNGKRGHGSYYRGYGYAAPGDDDSRNGRREGSS